MPLIRPMLIVCPSCAAAYDVDPAILPPQGRQVRCQRCGAVWRAEPSRADKLLAAAAAIAPDNGIPEDVVGVLAGTAVSAEAASQDFLPEASMRAQPGDPQAPNQESLVTAADVASGPASAAAVNEPSSGPTRNAAEVEAPPIVPVDLEQAQAAIDTTADASAKHRGEAAGDIETVAARRQRRSPHRRMLAWPLSHLQTCILVLLLVDAVLIGRRTDVVRALPQTASFYAFIGLPVNLRGLAFDGVVATMEKYEGVPILVVVGNIVNGAHKTADVARLKFIVRNAARQEIYSWVAVPSRSLLPPGEAAAFRSRLASPPPGARDLVVRFLSHRDIITGIR